MKIAIFSLALLPFLSFPALADSTITVKHGKAPDPTYIDFGTPGESVGDERIWQFDAKTAEGETVVMDWVMLTTGGVDGTPGLERRTTSAVFSFSSGPNDRILIEGIGLYPSAAATAKVDATLERAIIGGTGKYAGARGTALSTHLEDGSWQHVLRVQ